jgi:hypothetical protein
LESSFFAHYLTYKTHMKHIYLASLMLLLSLCSYSQYTQNFDTLANSGTGTFSILPEGWGIYEVESGTGSQGEGKYSVATGSSSTGNTYSFGAAGAADRALGSIASNTLTPSYGVLFYNESDSIITTLTISYTGEQYRYGGRTTGTQDSLRFEYSLSATGLAASGGGTWTAVTALTFRSPNTTGTAALTLDGNAAQNRQLITYTLTGLSIEPGGSLLLRWSDINIAGNDDGLGIDAFSISTSLALGVLTSGGTNTGGGTGDGGNTVTNTSTSVPIFQNKVAIDSGFVHLYGNMHSHTTFSDGRTSTGQPIDAYNFAKSALGMDFLGISEHNHYTAGMRISNYKIGVQQSNAANGTLNVAGQPFVALYGMEYGTISGGGHVNLYGFGDTLIGWESGAGGWGPTNNYDLFNPKSDYISLFDKVRNNPTAIALLAHPNTSDYTGLTGGYKGVGDSAIASTVIESGPAFSTSTTYSDYPSALAYMSYYRNLLKQGYRVGAHMDQDNHELTYGTANGNRMVVLSKDRSREGVLMAIKAMRVYASNDYNAAVNFTINNYIMGSSIITSADLSAVISHSDGNGEGLSVIQVYGGRVRGGDATLIHSSTTNTTFPISQTDGDTWYYYAIITQSDGNKIITAPIWVTKAVMAPLPVMLVDFSAKAAGNVVTLNWKTATEINSDYFAVERSVDLVSFKEIGKVTSRGSGSAYSLIDPNASKGVNYYRLRQVDKNGAVEYSKIVTVNLAKQYTLSLAPNPSRGVVQVLSSMPPGRKVMVQVIDIAGNRVYNKQHTSSPNMTVDLTQLPSGFYVVRVGDGLAQLVIQK